MVWGWPGMESAGPNQASEARGGGGGGKLGLSHRGVERLANKMFFFFGGGGFLAIGIV